MPSVTAPKSCILGTGAYAPDRILTNADLERLGDTSDAWITEPTGIKERRVAADDQASSDIALFAAQRALEAAGLTAKDLDMIIVGTVPPDLPMPACGDPAAEARRTRDPFVRHFGSVRGLHLRDVD